MQNKAAKERVLLVDDEPQVLVALEDLLCEKFVCFKAQSAERALRILEQERDIAVIVTDQRMPRMNGDELLAQVAETADALRILVTGFADLSAVIRAVNDGKIFAYVTKPWNADDLRLKVDKAADHFRLNKLLAYERQLLHDLMTNIPDGIYFKDSDLRFLQANQPYASMMAAANPDEMVGQRLRDMPNAGFDAEIREREEAEIIARGQPTQDVVREFRLKNERRFVSETRAPIRGSEGVIGLVGISRDVTQQRRLEEQLTQSQKMEAIGLLAGGVAHDFNNLLVVIESYSELLLQDLPEGDSKRDDIREILGAGRRASALTRQLLAFSRRQVLQTSLLDLNEIVANIEKMLRRIIGEDVDLVTDLDPALGTIKADPGQIEQIIVNLTVNARDAMPKGGKVVIETRNLELDEDYAELHAGVKAGHYVMLAVTDTGTGMDEATQKRIFEPFFTTKEVGKGTGLGLSTVYGIAQQSGGHIWVYSELNRGTSFKTYFPRADAKTASSGSRIPKAQTHNGVGTILLVEDDEAVRNVTARVLRERGYTVFETRRPSEARAVCQDRSKSIDLLLTDIVMPETSGPRLAEELSQFNPQMRVLFMSGYAGAALEHAGWLDDGAAYLEKPFSPAILAEKVRTLLEPDA
jgi:two-component system cell cycle sensor histidine kinase/response regulator CckA